MINPGLETLEGMITRDSRRATGTEKDNAFLLFKMQLQPLRATRSSQQLTTCQSGGPPLISLASRVRNTVEDMIARDSRRATGTEKGNAFLQFQSAAAALESNQVKSAIDQLPIRWAPLDLPDDGNCRSRGVVWASQCQLQNLATESGALFLMDATHKTNNLSWSLFTIYIRDASGSWMPAGHMLLERQRASLIALAIRKLQEWVPEWRPRYSVTDDSKAEQLAVRDAFVASGIEQYLCQWHVRQLFVKHFRAKYYPEVLRHLEHALLHARSEEQVREDLELAVGKLQKRKKSPKANGPELDEKMNYLIRNWPASDSHRWANWGRITNPLLLQVRTTSPLEGYHSRLKYKTKADMPSWSLLGLMKDVVEVDD